jgi:hypothetical protein
MLKALVSRFTFNPFALMTLTGQEQRRVMLECLGVNFDDLEADVERLKEERKIVGRDVHSRERQIAGMPEYAGVPAAEVSTKKVADELSKAEAVLRANDGKRAEAKRAAGIVASCEAALADADAAVARAEAEVVRAKECRDAQAEVVTEASKARELAESAVGALKDPDTAAIKAKLSTADAVNAKVRANMARAALVAQFQTDHDKYKELGEELEGIEQKKQDRLNAAKCPVKGLEFRDDGVWYEGLPLSQDMESDQMIRSVQLAAALNPKLRTIVLDNGERMLPAKMAELDAWADANDYQIIMFRASGPAENCAFYLENGRVREDDAPPDI